MGVSVLQYSYSVYTVAPSDCSLTGAASFSMVTLPSRRQMRAVSPLCSVHSSIRSAKAS